MAKRKRSFLSRHGRWIGANAVIGVALAPFLMTEQFQATAQTIANRIESAPDSLSALVLVQDILFFVIAPVALTLLIMMAISGLTFLVLTTAFAIVFPPILRMMFDGFLHMSAIMLALFATRIVPDAALFPFAMLIYVPLTLPQLWARLPWSLTYRDKVQLDLDMPVEEVRNRTFPGAAPHAELADAAWLNEEQTHVFSPAHPEDLLIEARENGGLRVTDPPLAPGYAFRVMDMHVTELAPDRTRLNLDITIKQCSTYEFCDFWTRPFAADYADYLYARLTGAKDRSRYGALLRGYLKKARRKAVRPQLATS